MPRPAHHDIPPVFDITIEGLFQGEQLRTPFMNGEHVHTERCLHRCELVDLVYQNLRAGIPLQGNFNTGVLIGKVSHPGNSCQDLLIHELCNSLLKCRPVYSIGNFRDGNDRRPVVFFIYLHFASHFDRPTTGSEVALNSLYPSNLAGHWKIRPFNELHQLRQSNLRIVDLRAESIHNLSQIMRRNIGRHSHCDTCTSVDEEVREGCRKYCRLGSRLVIVGNEINSSLVEIGHHRHPEMRQAGLGVTHCRGRVGLRRPKVPLTVDKNFPHRPVLRHIDKGRVDDCFSVRMIVS